MEDDLKWNKTFHKKTATNPQNQILLFISAVYLYDVYPCET